MQMQSGVSQLEFRHSERINEVETNSSPLAGANVVRGWQGLVGSVSYRYFTSSSVKTVF